MPWHKEENHAGCAQSEPWAVVEDDDGEVVGCHATEEAADKQIEALYDAEEMEKKSGDIDDEDDDDDDHVPVMCARSTEVTTLQTSDSPPDRIKVGDGSFMGAAEFDRAQRWRGVLVVEGITTGDGREFSTDALSWVDVPLIRWQKESSHGGDHDVTVAVGRADRVWRDGNRIMAEGVLDLRSYDGFEIYRRMSDGFAGGISIDADDIADPDVEVVWPDTPDEPDENDDMLMQLFGSPEKLIYHGGRIRAATLVDIPAFVEARIELVGDNADFNSVTASAGVLTMGAVASHDTPTVDGPWDAAVNEKRLPSPMPVATARNTYAWIDDGAIKDGEIPKTSGKFIHHDISADGTPGAANLTACSSGIGVLNGGRGGTTIPRDEWQGVYDHLAAHLRDADREPPPAQFADETLTASVALMNEWRPSRSWFTNPGFKVPVDITITDRNQIYGHAAQWGECHVGFDDLCVTPPVEDYHSYFMTGEVVCDDGTRVAVGQITVATGHAPLSYGAARATEHYDNTGSVVADVVVGNDDVGIWVAGAVRPHAESSRVYDLRASGRVSGDWRRIGGQLRLVGLLGVNVAGFPLKTRARVASGVPQSLVAAGFMTTGNMNAIVVSEKDQDTAAMRRVMSMLAERIRGGVSNV